MNKIKITSSQPVKWSSNGKPQKTLTYTHKEGGELSAVGTITNLCTNLVAWMEYDGLKKFTIQVIE